MPDAKVRRRHRRELRRRGWTVVPGLVGAEALAIARAAIERTLAERGPDAVDHQVFLGHDRCPALRHDPAVMQLLQGPILSYAEQLAGGSVFRNEICSQTAMRFPVSEPSSLLGVHVDGVATGQTTEPDSVTLLISILLTPHRDRSCGATAIRSGSHREIASAANAMEGVISGGMVAERISSLSHEGMDYVLGEPGDVFFGVWPLLHSATTVAIAEPRCAVFFRLMHVDHDPQRNVRDPFADLPALRRRYGRAGWFRQRRDAEERRGSDPRARAGR